MISKLKRRLSHSLARVLDKCASGVVRETAVYKDALYAQTLQEQLHARVLADACEDHKGTIENLIERSEQARYKTMEIERKTKEAVRQIEAATHDVVATILTGSSPLNPDQVEGLNTSLAHAYKRKAREYEEVLLDNRQLQESLITNVAIAYASLSRKFARTPLAVCSSRSVGYSSPILADKYNLLEKDLLNSIGTIPVQKALSSKGHTASSFEDYDLHFVRCHISDDAFADVVYLVPHGKSGKLRSRARLVKRYGEAAIKSLQRFIEQYKELKTQPILS